MSMHVGGTRPGFVRVNGHEVPEHLAEWFVHASTGEPLSDEEWDVTRDRLRELGEWPFDDPNLPR